MLADALGFLLYVVGVVGTAYLLSWAICRIFGIKDEDDAPACDCPVCDPDVQALGDLYDNPPVPDKYSKWLADHSEALQQYTEDEHPWSQCPKCNSRRIDERVLYSCSDMTCRECGHTYVDWATGER